MLAAQPLDLGPVRRLGRVDPTGTDDGLADERGDLRAALVEQRAEALGVVERRRSTTSSMNAPP